MLQEQTELVVLSLGMALNHVALADMVQKDKVLKGMFQQGLEDKVQED